jgi:putative transcriptional regulator
LSKEQAVPIIVNLDVVLAKRKMRLNTVAELVGVTAQNLSILKTGKAKAIRFTTLEKLCEVLDCQPGDILEYRDADHDRSSEPRRLRA